MTIDIVQLCVCLVIVLLMSIALIAISYEASHDDVQDLVQPPLA